MIRHSPYRRSPILAALVAAWLLGAARALAAASGYDPLAAAPGFQAEVADLRVHDLRRERELPVHVYLPASRSPAPVVLFSHGLGGSRLGNAYLGEHWAARGYAAVFLQHPGSDDSVWKDKPLGQRMDALRRAASFANFMLRVKDVPAVIDQLERWNQAPGHILAGRLDLARIGMSGHSFGAVTTQAVSGQRFLGGGWSFTDRRIKAALAFSPSAPAVGAPGRAFGAVGIPWLLMTGTLDVAPIGHADLASRLAVFPALPPGGKYELVLDGAEHSAFNERALPGDTQPRNPNHHRAVRALSAAFWDAWLRGDGAARAWLDGGGPRSVLEPRDRWQRK
jgi:predicted dienelactone hydrolase